jgi:hypothetical protein
VLRRLARLRDLDVELLLLFHRVTAANANMAPWMVRST